MSYLLDTNVVSEVRKDRPHAEVAKWFEGVDASGLYLSVLVIGEIRQGIERLRKHSEERAALLDAWLLTLKDVYGYRLLGISDEVAEEWGRMNAVRTLPVVDGLLAATALVHDLTLVTRNVVDVEGTGVKTLNPFLA